MPNPVSVDMASIITGASIGTLGATSGWSVYISIMPDAPNQVIILYDSGGPSPDPKFLLDNMSLNVRVRGDVWDYAATFAKAQAVKDALLGLPQQTINSTVYVGVWQVGDINFLRYDDQNRPEFSMNFHITRQPSTGTNRTAL